MVERQITGPAFGQVRIRVEACGICHTNAFTVEGGFPGLTYPRVPGLIGKIEAIGSGVRAWKEGQRVGVGCMGGNCGYCERCRGATWSICQNQPVSGFHMEGGHAEVMIAQVSGLAATPDHLSAAEGSPPFLCAGLTTFNGLTNSKARAPATSLPFKVSGLGHLGIQFARPAQRPSSSDGRGSRCAHPGYR